MVADAQVRVVEAEPQLALVGELLGDALEQVGGDLARPALVELLGGLGEVAEVGDEAPRPVGADDRGAARAGEARQPAHVAEVGDEQRVQVALAQRVAEAVGAGRSWRSSWCSCLELLLEAGQRLTVSVDALAADRRDAQVAHDGHAPELLARIDVGQVHLDGGSAAISSASRIAYE